jgi:hypothetical protein
VAAGDGGPNTDGKEERFVLRHLGSGVCNRTRVCGASAFTIRLPMVLVGAATILLFFFLSDSFAGLGAAL